ncbi:MAG: CoA transferase [Candidatus Bathyarchaeia archaeon]|jgi:crotonobetainyl-CoA:carnitine CoA-transferase CaiB-like acyl-CoA transferase
MASMKILDDIRVVDLTDHWFGPWCTLLLAELGADVIKVEPTWGATARIGGGQRLGGSDPVFHYLNMNKKSLSINLKADQGHMIFMELVKRSDIVVQNYLPGVMERLGLGYDALREANPRIIYAALSGFGQYGPYSNRASFDVVAEAMSGHTRLTGDLVDPNGPPLNMAESYGDLGPGTVAAYCIMAAIRNRDRKGIGQMLDVAQADCMVALNPAIVEYSMTGLLPWQIRERYPTTHISGIVKASDGWVQVAGFRPRALDALKEKLGVEVVTLAAVKEMVSGMTRDEAVEYFVDIGMPVAPVYQVNESLEDPHLNARGMFIEVEHSKVGKFRTVNFPVKFSDTPGEVKSAAPLIGQHNREILKGLLGYDEERIVELEKGGIIYTDK